MVGNCSSVAASGTRRSPAPARRRSPRRRGGGGRRRRSPWPSRAPARRWLPRRAAPCRRPPGARTPSWKPRRATGANRLASRDAVLAHPPNGSISIVWRSKERFVARVQRALRTPSRKSAKRLHLLGRGTVEVDRRQVEQHAVEQRGPSRAPSPREVQRERGGAVLEVLQHRLVAAAFASTTSTCVRTSHAPGAPVARGGEPVEVGGLPDRCDVDAVERRAASGPPRRRSRARRHRGGGPCAARRPWPPPTPLRRTRRRRRRAGGSPPRAAAPRARRVHRRGHQGGRSCCAG